MEETRTSGSQADEQSGGAGYGGTTGRPDEQGEQGGRREGGGEQGGGQEGGQPGPPSGEPGRQREQGGGSAEQGEMAEMRSGDAADRGPIAGEQ